MTKKVVVSQGVDDGECRIPAGAIDPDTIECPADLDAAIAAFDARNHEHPKRIHIAEWEGCEW